MLGLIGLSVVCVCGELFDCLVMVLIAMFSCCRGIGCNVLGLYLDFRSMLGLVGL